ncbi:hypothetical protein PGTUg99_006210 [Puccinia graminis f. sp. tritici]|uniref:Uncharacterized protein n=1 Tax=Puccinia graminis f. sp. tritici TaxID=56615 RepID=A0A5B0NC02_PUCGR|nr:hypothetical protein PGTUg99_006210 [Puccinia graminis f. sp. tritici]
MQDWLSIVRKGELPPMESNCLWRGFRANLRVVRKPFVNCIGRHQSFASFLSELFKSHPVYKSTRVDQIQSSYSCPGC